MTACRSLTLVATILLSSLGACSRSEPDRAPVENEAMDPAAAPESSAVPEASVPTPSETTDRNATAEVPPPAASSGNESVDAPAETPPDQQMMDDASAAGMTSRATRGDRATDDAAAGPTETK